MVLDHTDESCHYHIIDPMGGFMSERYETEAMAISRATVLQSFEAQTDAYYHILGVPDICTCSGRIHHE